MQNFAGAESHLATTGDGVVAAVARHPWFWITLIWLLFVLPGLNVRGAYFEEQTVLSLSRGAIEDGWWFTPHLYGERFVERPVLLSWLVALLSWPLGSIVLPLARLPTAVSGLAAAFLVYSFVKQRTSAAGGVVAALCLMASPAVFQDAFIAEPDLMLSTLMFAAFVVWWIGEERGNVGVLRWVCVGLLLTAAGLVKGPQPLAFFYSGVFAYYLTLRRDWRPILGLMLAGIIPATVIFAWYFAIYQPGDLVLWRQHSRLYFWQNGFGTQLFEFLDLAVRFLVAVLPSVVAIAIGRPRFDKSADNRNLLAALLLYAGLCTLLLWFWPGARYRYAMPGVPALAAAAGIVFDQMRLRADRARYAVLSVIAAFTTFQFALNWLVMANFPELFAKSRVSGRTVAAVMAAKPAPLYAAMGAADNALLLYVPPPIRRIPFAEFSRVKLPAWALLTPEQAAQLQASRPDLDLQTRLVLTKYANAQLIYVAARR